MKYEISFGGGLSKEIWDEVAFSGQWITCWNFNSSERIHYPVWKIQAVREFEPTPEPYRREPGVTWDEIAVRD